MKDTVLTLIILVPEGRKMLLGQDLEKTNKAANIAASIHVKYSQRKMVIRIIACIGRTINVAYCRKNNYIP